MHKIIIIIINNIGLSIQIYACCPWNTSNHNHNHNNFTFNAENIATPNCFAFMMSESSQLPDACQSQIEYMGAMGALVRKASAMFKFASDPAKRHCRNKFV